MCAGAMWYGCIRCAGARLKRSKRSFTGTKALARRRQTVAEIELPEGTLIGAIVRGEEVIMAHHDTVVQSDDHVILFLSDRRHLEAVEKLFLRNLPVGGTPAMLGVAHVLGLVLAIFGAAYVLPVGCSIVMGDGLWLQFIIAAAINSGVGWPSRSPP